MFERPRQTLVVKNLGKESAKDLNRGPRRSVTHMRFPISKNNQLASAMPTGQ